MDFITVFWVGVWFGVLVLIAHLVTEVPKDGGPMRYQRWHAAFVMSRDRRAERRAGVVPNRDETASNRTENEPELLPNPAPQSGSTRLTGAFVLNPQEVAAVGRMIEHKASAEKPTKASTIWAGFALKKGESTRYKRASEIYDTLFVVQPDFPALEATRQPRWEPDDATAAPASHPVTS